MRESLRGYALGVMYLADKSGKRDQIVREANSFAAILGSQEMLAEVISDPSVPPRKRQAILGQVLSGKVDDLLIRLLEVFVGTENPRSVVSSIVELSRVLSHESELVLDGGFATTGRVSGYAQALLESLEGTADLEQVEEELYRFARIVESNTRIRRVLSGIGSDASQRAALASDLLSGKSHELTQKIAVLAASVDRLRDFVEVVDDVVARAAKIRDRRIAKVDSAKELTPDQIAQISAALARVVGSDVEVRTNVDPSLIGGVVAVVGDTVFDGSVRNRIEQLRIRLGLPATVKSRERN